MLTYSFNLLQSKWETLQTVFLSQPVNFYWLWKQHQWLKICNHRKWKSSKLNLPYYKCDMDFYNLTWISISDEHCILSVLCLCSVLIDSILNIHFLNSKQTNFKLTIVDTVFSLSCLKGNIGIGIISRYDLICCEPKEHDWFSRIYFSLSTMSLRKSISVLFFTLWSRWMSY